MIDDDFDDLEPRDVLLRGEEPRESHLSEEDLARERVEVETRDRPRPLRLVESTGGERTELRLCARGHEVHARPGAATVGYCVACGRAHVGLLPTEPALLAVALEQLAIEADLAVGFWARARESSSWYRLLEDRARETASRLRRRAAELRVIDVAAEE